MIAAPKVLQAVFAAMTDFFTYLLACKIYGAEHSASWVTLASTVVSPWQWFASVRTLSNSLETTLTIVALNFWPWDWFLELDGRPDHQNEIRRSLPTKLYMSLNTAAVACILRPTNIMVWATVSTTLLWRYGNSHKVITLARAAVLCGSAVFAASVSMDRAFYGDWVFPPLRFLYFNVVQSLAVFYGQNRRDYYFTEGLPLLLTTALPFAVIGIAHALRSGLRGTTVPGSRPQDRKQGYPERQIHFVLALAVATSVIALSVISHKEVRFIYPLLPMLHILAAKPMATFFHPFPRPAKRWRHVVLNLGVTLNMCIAAYTGYVHQRGVVDVMHYLRQEYEKSLLPHSPDTLGPSVAPNMTVGFFMPCHSTPWRSHLVFSEIDAWALACEPPLHLTMEERDSYFDEADVFYNDPVSWIHENMQDLNSVSKNSSVGKESQPNDENHRTWPHYLVFFQQLEPTMETILGESKYRQCWRGFNTHWHDDWRRQGDVVIWCLRSSSGGKI